ncbi:uncharacterized protein LOC101849520 [Aplysia californica]|uniref:Uncharacterized protein LOC101849520 n=1 Tax=Aplysia californica TaxID=6500 RepID=A0ABM0KB30_APLCA|nr:uncharacterized protein LOC101849520 [Aplysia californica]
MPMLSRENSERAVGRLATGELVEQVSQVFSVHPSTIYHLRNRLQATATTTDRPRSGRPRVTTPAHDRVIVRRHRRDPFLPAAETARTTMGTTGRQLSRWTVSRRLVTAGLHCRRPYQGAVLTPRPRQQRLQWVQAHVNWRNAQWRRVLFSDESRFVWIQRMAVSVCGVEARLATTTRTLWSVTPGEARM